MTSPTDEAVSNETRWTGRLRWRALVTAVAAVAPVAVWLVAVPVLGYDLLVPQSGGGDATEVTLPAVITTGLVVSLAGWGLLAALERVSSRRAVAVWRSVAVLTLLVSFVPLLLTEGIGAATWVTLAVMHLVVAAVLIPALPRDRRA